MMLNNPIASWNVIIAGCNKRGFDLEALASNMLKDFSLKPDKFTLASILSACANLEKAICDLKSQYHCFTALLDGYIKLGDIKPARQIFDSLRDRDVVAWTALIVGYVRNGLNNDVLELFRLMIKEGPKPNNYTFAAILSVSSTMVSLDQGKQIHASAMRSGEVLSVSVSNSLITMYSKGGSINAAKKKITERDIASWNVIIAGRNKRGFDLEALASNMLKDSSLKPDKFTLASILSACANLEKAICDLKSQYHCFTALLDGYIKLGDIKPARQIFDSLRDRDVVAWTALIVGYVRNGLNNDVLELFRLMIKEGPKPNNYTFAAILSVSSTMVSLDQGKQIHASAMRSGEVLSVSVSNSLITMYSKGGSINAAKKVHKNVDLAKVAAERLLLIDPENNGAYSALANLYSAHGKWEDAARVRKSMKDRGVKKEQQGFSRIQIQNTVHVFGIEDGMHPQKDAIYKMTEKIRKEINWGKKKLLGFIPDTQSVLNDLEGKGERTDS
ncbi:Tetratricopeptide-like helical domain containing protein [Trema orientale]|uniref:Tetratricopeptide-like helical domain containing protein n=1 Tax=Trema orientale TaxID=63057 RepID=A0A2P5ABF6_TREOI|nr:Tetratricopeptide-like helical domain containing protein [Trema orientale]